VVLFRSDVPHLESLADHELMIDEHSSCGQVSAYHLRHKYWRGPIETKITKISENQIEIWSRFSNFHEILAKC
jgi:hypothetical protein